MDGQATADRKQWRSGLESFLADKYMDESATEEAQVQQDKFLRAVQHLDELDGLRATEWTFGTTMRARTRLKLGRAAGGGDILVPEMLAALSWVACMVVHACFVLRYMGDPTSTDLSWSLIELILIGKVRNPKEFKDFRGISLINILAKWYMAGLMDIARQEVAKMMNPM